MKNITPYPKKGSIAWMIINIIKTAGPNGIRRKYIMQILFRVLGKGAYDTRYDRGWYSSYFNYPHNPSFYNPYGIVPKLCTKIDGKYWVLNPTWKNKKRT